MMLEEANARLKKTQINSEQLWGLNSLYILLDLHKDDFCKMVDMVGVETLLKKQRHYDRLMKAEEELAAKERYLQAKARLEELEVEKGDKYGWHITKLTPETLEYIESLGEAGFNLSRRKVVKTSKSRQSARKYTCPSCGMSIRATKEVRVKCGDCDELMIDESGC